MIPVSFVIWVVIKQYLFCPTFTFTEPKPFSGSSLYNPYDSMDACQWKKCNFHAHTNAWHGMTHGTGSARDVCRVYDSMHYAVHCVSDYQSINQIDESTPGYIPAYEHGYNAGKTHQLVLGSNEVKWLDYFLPQTINNKQDVLNALRRVDNVVFVNHPSSFHGYNASDFKYLSNYDCMEVLSPYAISTACWDTALSNGKAVFVAGDDDGHNIFSKETVGKMCTFINVNAINQKNVLNALKRGKSYGVIVGGSKRDLPILNSFKLSGDTLSLIMSEPADKISFIGQNGKLLQTSEHAGSASYLIQPADRYVRAVIDYPDGRSIFLNPVFRYEKTHLLSSFFHINVYATNIKRALGLLFFVIWARIAFSLLFIKSPRKQPAAEPLAFQ